MRYCQLFGMRRHKNAADILSEFKSRRIQGHTYEFLCVCVLIGCSIVLALICTCATRRWNVDYFWIAFWWSRKNGILCCYVFFKFSPCFVFHFSLNQILTYTYVRVHLYVPCNGKVYICSNFTATHVWHIWIVLKAILPFVCVFAF